MPVGHEMLRRGASGKTYFTPVVPRKFTYAGSALNMSQSPGGEYIPWSSTTVCVCAPRGGTTTSPGSSEVVRLPGPERWLRGGWAPPVWSTSADLMSSWHVRSTSHPARPSAPGPGGTFLAAQAARAARASAAE